MARIPKSVPPRSDAGDNRIPQPDDGSAAAPIPSAPRDPERAGLRPSCPAARRADDLRPASPDPGVGTGDEYPSYSERQWERRLNRHPTRPIPESTAGLPPSVMDYLAVSALTEVLDGLALSPLERAVAERRLAGASVREIAAETGVKKWRIERALEVVRRRLTAARHVALADASSGPVRRASGWQEVYLAETRRRGKR